MDAVPNIIFECVIEFFQVLYTLTYIDMEYVPTYSVLRELT